MESRPDSEKLSVGIYILTLGCKVNQCDADEMAQSLAAHGYRIVGRDDHADVYLVNTCAVTATAESKARKLIRKLARAHPAASVIVTGCWPQRDPRAVAALPEVDAVVPNTRKPEIVEIVANFRSPPSAEAVPPSRHRTRAFLKIQDGCDHRCTYCAVPDARGRPVSKPRDLVLGEMADLARSGAQEVVLCGIRLGAYGRDLGGAGLADLLRHLREIDIPRLRLSSLEPMDVDQALLDEIADHPRLCHHLHLPLQSGDDDTLAAMGRGYETAEYRDLVTGIRAVWPDAALSTDVIAGFPGETEVQFARTAALLRELAFSRTHVFPFSSRPGTLAAQTRDQVPPDIKRDRTHRLLAVAAELAQQAAQSWVGRKVSVLFEEHDDEGRLTGLTQHYVRIHSEGPAEHIGRIAEVVPERAENGELFGKL
jgi:threonylcarbamoyladenosine tRNA methylthiotransferase MtaB